MIKAGGWLMLPLIACSVTALAIVLERCWALRRSVVFPRPLLAELRQWAQGGPISQGNLAGVSARSPLGRIVASALVNRYRPRQITKEGIEDTGRHVVHELERFLNTLGTIAVVSPLLGLLGTVVGIIDVFSVISLQGGGDPNALAGGIAKALVTTAVGLVVAIPSLMFYRYFRGRVDEFVVEMEQQAIQLVDILHADSAGEQA